MHAYKLKILTHNKKAKLLKIHQKYAALTPAHFYFKKLLQ